MKRFCFVFFALILLAVAIAGCGSAISTTEATTTTVASATTEPAKVTTSAPTSTIELTTTSVAPASTSTSQTTTTTSEAASAEDAIRYFLQQGSWVGDGRLENWKHVLLAFATDPETVTWLESPEYLLISFIPNETGLTFCMLAWAGMSSNVPKVVAMDPENWPEQYRPFVEEVQNALANNSFVPQS